MVDVKLSARNELGEVKVIATKKMALAESTRLRTDFEAFINNGSPKSGTYDCLRDMSGQETKLTVKFDEIVLIS